MIKRYDSVLANLSQVEMKLLQRPLRQLDEKVKTGFQPLNWNSLHITTFSNNCNSALNDFEKTIAQVCKPQRNR